MSDLNQHQAALLGVNNGDFRLSIRPAELLAVPHLSHEDIDLICWVHQHGSKSNVSWAKQAKEIGVSSKTLLSVCRGVYEAKNWTKVLDKFRVFQAARLAEMSPENFVENAQASRIFEALDYISNSGTLGMIVAESRSGKTASAREWIRRNKLGTGLLVECPVNGGTGGLIQEIGKPLGIGAQKYAVHRSVTRIKSALSSRNVLILDEAGRLIPNRKKGTEKTLETIREIRDAVKCAIVLLVTERDTVALRESNYQFEQVLGRFALPPVRVPEFEREDVDPICRQWGEFEDSTLDAALKVARAPGHLDTLKEILRAAKRVADKLGAPIPTDDHYRAAVDYRQRLASGDR